MGGKRKSFVAMSVRACSEENAGLRLAVGREYGRMHANAFLKDQDRIESFLVFRKEVAKEVSSIAFERRVIQVDGEAIVNEHIDLVEVGHLHGNPVKEVALRLVGKVFGGVTLH